jgi:hypothetical protein
MPEANENEIVAPKKGRMGDDELLSLIRQYEAASLGSNVAAGATVSTTIFPSNQALTTLEIDRYNALNAYLARPLGNEIENRSQVVLPTLRDTIEWIMPQLMRMFVATKTVCRFDPEGQADEQQAEQETLAVNHVFMNQNNGVIILHDYFKDALLMRNGYVEVTTEEEKSVTEERYKQLTEDQVTELMKESEDQKVTVLGQKEYGVSIPGMPQPLKVFDIHIRKAGTVKKVCVTCLPPEEMRVSSRAREGMEDIPFSQHITTLTRSDLVADGHDAALVATLQTGRPSWLDIDALARNVVVDQLSVENPADRAMQEIEVRKVIMKVDYDGDGIAELRRILVGGDKILENEIVEETPFVSGAPMRMPHRHTGMSMYDLVMDLQVISTNLWRQGLDNLANANNTRVAVDWRRVNFDDLLTSRPGAPIRGDGPPQQWIQPIEMPSNLIEQVIPALQYIDQMRSNRTGIGKGTMGLDADELQNVTKGGQLASMSAATLIVELIARMLAEGVKGIFLKIHSELRRNQDKPLEFELTQGKWMKTDPSQWRRRTGITPNVGLGSGNSEERRANATLLAQAVQLLVQGGLAGPKQILEAFKVYCDALGYQNPERFAMDPNGQEFQQHQKQMQSMPNPAVQVAQIKAQTEKEKQQSETQREVVRLEGELAQAREKLIADQRKHLDELSQGAHDDSRNRQVELTQQHQDLINNLIKIFGTIEASKAKAGMDITGQMVGADIDQAASAIEHNQTMVQQDQSHQHTMQQTQSQQSEKEPAQPAKPKRRIGKMKREDDGSYSFEMSDE